MKLSVARKQNSTACLVVSFLFRICNLPVFLSLFNAVGQKVEPCQNVVDITCMYLNGIFVYKTLLKDCPDPCIKTAYKVSTQSSSGK